MPQSGLARRSNYVVLAEGVGEGGCDDGGVIAEHAAAPGTQHQLAVTVCSRDLEHASDSGAQHGGYGDGVSGGLAVMAAKVRCCRGQELHVHGVG
jgi:hypothetical protein